MSRSSSTPSLQLFPFLAVLVCTMGALILLLLVTTTRMRKVAVARATAKAEAEAQNALPPQPADGPELISSGPTEAELATREQRRAARQAEFEARQTANAEARKRQAERESAWQRELATAEISRDQRRQALTAAESDLTGLQQRLQATETSLQKLADKKSKIKNLQNQDARTLSQAEQEHEKLSDEITKAQTKLANLKRSHADSASRFAFIPYDGASGTTRRPIYLECSSRGIRFQPENELLEEDDLKGFTEQYNPLLLACDKLIRYWREQPNTSTDAEKTGEPYVLLVVRPSGTVSYYVARKMLSQLGDDFGYELVEDDFPLQLPAADPDAKVVIQRALAEALKNRGEALAAGSHIGAPRLGEVMLGREPEVIDFGSLNEQAAVEKARDESPFTKNSPISGKGFSVTRSPLREGEMLQPLTGKPKGSRRPGGGSGSLGSLENRVSDREPELPGSLAEMVERPGGPGPAALLPRNGSGKADESKTYALSDPFDRSSPAAGQPGPGAESTAGAPGSPTVADFNSNRLGGDTTVNSGESATEPVGTAERQGDSAFETGSTAGDAGTSNSKSGGTAGGTAGRTRTNKAQGAKPGKLIDDLGDASPINEVASPGATASRTGTGRTTGRNQRTSADTQSAPPGTTGEESAAGSDDSSPPPQGSSTAQTGTRQRAANSSADHESGSPTDPSGNARQRHGGQRGGSPSRATGSRAAPQREYGDNPEARRDLAKLSKAMSTSSSPMKKRDEARRRWGGSNTGQIGFERQLAMQVSADKIVIGKNEIEVIVEPDTTADDLVESVLEALDEHSQTWGPPPTRFYWVPYLKFDVRPGGNVNYERLHGALRDWGIFSEAKFPDAAAETKVATKPPPGSPQQKAAPAAPGRASVKVQPIRPPATNSKTPSGPPLKRTENGRPLPAQSSGDPWYKRLWQGNFTF